MVATDPTHTYTYTRTS